MTSPSFDFHFRREHLFSAQGAIAPAEQFFEGSNAADSLAREIGQNSLDARAGSSPVLIRFELTEVATNDLPGIETLRTHYEAVASETKGMQGNDRMVGAFEASLMPSISVLRISDFGTRGLTGSESVNASASALSALTRGAGVSANDGLRGGSFGIGSAVGPMSSSLCTVFYTSIPVNESDVVFAGYSRLASHRDSTGAWRSAEGFFTDTSRTDDFSYLRNPPMIGSFDIRTEPGTDIYVLGYRRSEADPYLEQIRKAYVRHFLVAIHRGQLEVEGVAGGHSWRIDSANLYENLRGDEEAEAFYEALLDENPIERVSDRFGLMTLYINVDDTLKKSLHTYAVRSPLMKIHTFKASSIHAKYAAILECADESGNKILREMEPPQHDMWDPGRADGGATALAELRKFIRDGLRSRVEENLGETVEIEGLSKYLPSQDFEISKEGFGRIPADGEGSGDESASVHGKESLPYDVALPVRQAVKVAVRTTTGSEGSDPVSKGKDRGGENRRGSGEPGLPGVGGEGDGSARISRGDVRFRSWAGSQADELFLALTPAADIQGNLELVAIGAGDAAEEGYVLPIKNALVIGADSFDALNWEANVLRGVSLTAGETTRIRLQLKGDRRYRLDVK
jgi:hypothetical protein